MSTDPIHPAVIAVTDPTAAMVADMRRCIRCGVRFADNGGRCVSRFGCPQIWWTTLKINHDEGRAVTPYIRGGLICRDEGQSDAAHTRFYAAQLLAAADALDAQLAEAEVAIAAGAGPAMPEVHTPVNDDGATYCGWSTGTEVIAGCGYPVAVSNRPGQRGV